MDVDGRVAALLVMIIIGAAVALGTYIGYQLATGGAITLRGVILAVVGGALGGAVAQIIGLGALALGLTALGTTLTGAAMGATELMIGAAVMFIAGIATGALAAEMMNLADAVSKRFSATGMALDIAMG